MKKKVDNSQICPVVMWLPSHFGEFADFELPNGATAIILCIDRFGHQPRFLKLSHQIYREELKRLSVENPGIKSFTIFPIRNDEAITIQLSSIFS